MVDIRFSLTDAKKSDLCVTNVIKARIRKRSTRGRKRKRNSRYQEERNKKEVASNGVAGQTYLVKNDILHIRNGFLCSNFQPVNPHVITRLIPHGPETVHRPVLFAIPKRYHK